MNGDFLGLGLKNKALNSDNIADIPLFESGLNILAYIVTLNIKLNSAGRIA